MGHRGVTMAKKRESDFAFPRCCGMQMKRLYINGSYNGSEYKNGSIAIGWLCMHCDKWQLHDNLEIGHKKRKSRQHTPKCKGNMYKVVVITSQLVPLTKHRERVGWYCPECHEFVIDRAKSIKDWLK